MGKRTYTPDIDEIAADWVEFTGGPPILAVLGTFLPADVEALVLIDDEGGRQATISWFRKDDVAELVSVHASPPGGGMGAELLSHIEPMLRDAGVRRLLVATTSDNVDALRFYVRQGFRLVRLHLDWMDKVRQVKPGVPLAGNAGLPLQDLWELEKAL